MDVCSVYTLLILNDCSLLPRLNSSHWHLETEALATSMIISCRSKIKIMCLPSTLSFNPLMYYHRAQLTKPP